MKWNFDNRTVWDFDGTIALSCFNDPCWTVACNLAKNIRTQAAFTVINPLVNTMDVEAILTARFDDKEHREHTRYLINSLGLSDSLVFMNNRRDHTYEGFAKFKSDWCNEHRPKYYVDDDPHICMLMRKNLDYTQCVTVEDWYRLNPSFPSSPHTLIQLPMNLLQARKGAIV